MVSSRTSRSVSTNAKLYLMLYSLSLIFVYGSYHWSTLVSRLERRKITRSNSYEKLYVKELWPLVVVILTPIKLDGAQNVLYAVHRFQLMLLPFTRFRHDRPFDAIFVTELWQNSTTQAFQEDVPDAPDKKEIEEQLKTNRKVYTPSSETLHTTSKVFKA